MDCKKGHVLKSAALPAADEARAAAPPTLAIARSGAAYGNGPRAPAAATDERMRRREGLAGRAATPCGRREASRAARAVPVRVRMACVVVDRGRVTSAIRANHASRLKPAQEIRRRAPGLGPGSGSGPGAECCRVGRESRTGPARPHWQAYPRPLALVSGQHHDGSEPPSQDGTPRPSPARPRPAHLLLILHPPAAEAAAEVAAAAGWHAGNFLARRGRL
jgi:hypothetical protein